MNKRICPILENFGPFGPYTFNQSLCVRTPTEFTKYYLYRVAQNTAVGSNDDVTGSLRFVRAPRNELEQERLELEIEMDKRTGFVSRCLAALALSWGWIWFGVRVLYFLHNAVAVVSYIVFIATS
jgi:hypothetical protein